jgi:glutaredoxin
VATVTVYTRQGCHLCADAERLVHQLVGPEHTVVIVDIDADPALTDAYTVRVPVVAVDGREVAQYQVDPAALTLALR